MSNNQAPIRPSSLPPPTRLTALGETLSQSLILATPQPLDQEFTFPVSENDAQGDQVEQIDLDDVLDASFLEDSYSSSDHGGPSSSAQAHAGSGQSSSHMKNLSRWDLISVGAFRKTREGVLSDGWGSDTSGARPKDYGSVMRNSPLSSVLWNNRLGAAATSPAESRGGRSRSGMNVVVSPVLLPQGDRDGEMTPTSNAVTSASVLPHHYSKSPYKGRKDSRRDKLRRKGSGAVHHQHHHHKSGGVGGAAHPHHQHHSHHQHHPNSKSRSVSSSQRTNFFAGAQGSVPPLNI